MRRSIVPLLVVALTGCGSTHDAEDGTSDCTRYQERLDGACREVRPIGLESRELSFERDGYTLHGTLVLPVTEGDYRAPVLVLVHGSGPNDRDETTEGNLRITYGQEIPTFRLLAEALGQMGAAVFRYDKRTCFQENSAGRCPTSIAAYPGDLDAIDVHDFVEDLRAAIRAVASQADVEGSDITVVGHSQGANFVPQVADEPGLIAGVQLAGPSLPADQAMVEQLREYADDLEAMGSRFEADVAAIRAEADRVEDALAQIRDGTYPSAFFDGAGVSFWKSWMDRTDHLREEFLAMNQPILVLNGDLDFNVRVSHLERFRTWADEAGKRNASFVVVPDATHSFVELTNGGARLGDLFSSTALEAITGWHRSLSR